MDLLERDSELAELGRHLEAARAGDGQVVLVHGDAGIGKTALVHAFCRGHAGAARVLQGWCDALLTPRALGPLTDLAAQAGGTLAALVREGARREALFDALLRALDHPAGATIAVIEDVHWADDATLDLVKHVGRRLAGRRCLLVLTYRDTEVRAGHPLRLVLGDLASNARPARVRLSPLSHGAIARLAAGHAVAPDTLYERTAGNPFFVTEVLAAPGADVPDTVRDAVLARVARLPGSGQEVLRTAAVVPSSVEPWLLQAGDDGGDPDAVAACVEAGLLAEHSDVLAFRHELARLAVEASLPASARRARHALVLRRLLAREAEVDPARIAHHADAAGETALAHRFALVAGNRAAAVSAHREAVAQYERALRHARGLEPASLAGLLEKLAQECSLTGKADAAVRHSERAVACWREAGDKLEEGRALTTLSGGYWEAGRNAECLETEAAAIALLASLPEGPELAAAYAARSRVRMLARHLGEAIEWGRRAVALAEQTGAHAALARALNTLGAAQLLTGDPQGRATLERSIDAGRAAGLDFMVAVGYSNLGTGLGEVRDYAAADHYLRLAIDFAREHDLDANRDYACSWWARSRFEQADWDEAARVASAVVGRSGIPIARIVALTVLGRLRARRGDPQVDEALDEAWELALGTRDLQRLWPVAAARAEAAWLRGASGAILPLVDETYELGRRLNHPWSIGELGFWRWRAGAPGPLPEGAYEPYALHVAGDHERAAAAWASIGCPYERALALADSADSDRAREALAELKRLGATVDAARVARQLRERGVLGLPRGPRPATRANPAGLTGRQLEVLRLLAAGDSNAVIARKLFISEKTAGHHVSAVLTKLGVRSRHEAARAAARLGRGAAGHEDGEPPPPT